MKKYNCGIYKIENVVNGKFYIGQSMRLSVRKVAHLLDLRRGTSHNKVLQRAYNKYGEFCFNFKTLIYCERFELDYYEQSLVDKLNPEYNVCKVCVGVPIGLPMSEETRLKRSLSASGEKNGFWGRKHSLESKQQMAESHCGKPGPWLGKHRSKETIEKLSKANKGKHPSEETKRKREETRQRHRLEKKNVTNAS